jgi:hypothetical protein
MQNDKVEEPCGLIRTVTGNSSLVIGVLPAVWLCYQCNMSDNYQQDLKLPK